MSFSRYCLLLVAAALQQQATAARRSPDPAPVGGVLTGVGEIDRSRPFIDLMKQSRAFSTLFNPNDQNASVDTFGWPTEDFAIACMTVGGGAAGDQYPVMQTGGIYTVYAIGNATLGPSNATSGVTLLNSTYVVSSNSFTAYLEVDQSSFNGNLWLWFTNTQRNPSSLAGSSTGGSGLTNISIIQPGYTYADITTGGKVFTDEWLNHLSRFDTIRTLPWSLNGTQTQYNWSDRPKVDAPSYLVGAYGSIGQGVPWEMIILLANTLGCDVWINIPAAVTDNYLVGLATLFRDTLHTDLTLILEYGNEMWNGHFIGHTINENLAYISVVNDGDPYHFAYDGSNSSATWAERRYAWMTMHMADVFSTVYPAGSVGAGKRVRNVLAGQGSYAPVAEAYLEYLDLFFGDPATLIAAFTIAPYFGLPEAENNQPVITTDQVIDGLNSTLLQMSWDFTYNSSNTLAAHVTVAAYYGIEMRGYEGGPATTGINSPVALMAKANATVDPRMESLLRYLLDMWKGYGCTVMNVHQAGATTTLAPWGSFGVLYDMTVPVTPKTLAIDGARSAPLPPLNAGLGLPLLNHNASLSVGYYGTPRNPVEYLPANTTMSYLIRVDKAGTGGLSRLNITIYASCVTNAYLEVALGHGNASALLVPVTKSLSDFEPMSIVFPLPQAPRMAVIKLRVITPQSYRLMSIDAIPIA